MFLIVFGKYAFIMDIMYNLYHYIMLFSPTRFVTLVSDGAYNTNICFFSVRSFKCKNIVIVRKINWMFEPFTWLNGYFTVWTNGK